MQGPPSGSSLFSVPLSSSPRSTSPPASEVLRFTGLPESAKPGESKLSKFEHVLVPRLSSVAKENYKTREEAGLKLEMEIDLDEIIGEYKEGRTLYYFARYQEGIAHKFPAQLFQKRHPALVEKYKEAKVAGWLKEFNPSAHYVHPMSRVKMTINISPGRRKARVSMSSARSIRSDASVQFVPDSEEEMAGGSENESYAGTPTAPRRATRQSHLKQSTLPFSPKKTRSQKIAAYDSDSEPDSSRPARRSARRKATVQINLDSDYESGDEDVESEYSSVRPPGKGKKQQPKVPVPSYGHIHDVATLKYDPFPDDVDNVALREHRDVCEKCHDKPAHILLRRLQKSKGKGKKRKRGSEDEFELSDSEKIRNMGGWVRCLKCPVAVHWQCLASTQQGEIMKAARNKDRLDWMSGASDAPLGRRATLEPEETTEFICASCAKGGICMGCMEPVKHAPLVPEAENDANNDVEMSPDNASEPAPPKLELEKTLLFRCFTCKRVAHYHHLPPPHSTTDASVSEIASYYQSKGWLCSNCLSFRYPLDKILAWRPYPVNAVQPVAINYREQLPREYLVKWAERSYRRLSWVPHMWLLSTNQTKLKNFLTGGTKAQLLTEIPTEQEQEAAVGEAETFEIGDTRSSGDADDLTTYGPLDALPDAEKRIPPAWKTVDRVLDVVFWDKEARRKSKKKEKTKTKSKRAVIESEEEEESAMEAGLPEAVEGIFETGELPESLSQLQASEWEDTNGEITEEDIDKVVFCFIKWDDLGYDEATWDSPPRRGEHGYDAFVKAFKRFIHSRSVFVPKLTRAEQAKIDNRPIGGYGKYILKDPAGLQLEQDPSLKLMPFQVDGFNWLCDNWWNHQTCILADDMGLGKTVQMATFLGTIASKWKAFPALVVVPNSTLTNWVREFERWAPALRVVPFYGERKAREVIKGFELSHDRAPEGYTNAKFHVLVTTYEGITGTKDWGTVFKRQPRWEVLVVDEGQRLKSDSSLLFKKLNELHSAHRVIMTGTPLNNNMRELFNLMNFLDPVEWKDLELLERQYEELDEDLIKQLHNRLRPYFLRRIKSEVLQLPPKNEVIVPVSMAPLQKKVYRSILSHNLDLLKGLTQPNKNSSVTKGKLNNILMHLRKCLQHPYLYSEDIEPQGIPQSEVHLKLVDASAKLRLLKVLLPKLKARGHRVLLFSQFVLALDVVEDFLNGEGYKFRRLDGNTKGSERQKSMDEYNKPNSDYFIFLLTTRAGGVGINLFTADTVIIFDPDFNPHQDLQAIARAYRYGQKKTCLVFKLMVKDSAEERIMQIGKKKLVLDHLIVQKMDEDEDSPGENVQSILTYGAQALFESDGATSKDITYSEQDIEKLIEKTESEVESTDGLKEGGLTFNFAKVWETDKNDLAEVGDEDQADAWAQTLEKINEERQKEMAQDKAVSGRGAKRRAATLANTKINAQEIESASPNKRRGSSATDVDFQDNDSIESDTASQVSGVTVDDDFAMDVDKQTKKSNKTRTRTVFPTVQLEDIESVSEEVIDCGLCGGKHGIKQCLMTENSRNLVEYRLMLIKYTDDEPWEERYAAVMAIDELLNSRGHSHLVYGQPLRPIPKANNIPPTKNPKEAVDMARAFMQKQWASNAPQPTMADYRGGSEIEIVRSFKTNGSNTKALGSSAIPGPSRQRHAGNSTATPLSFNKSVQRPVASTSNAGASGSTVQKPIHQKLNAATTSSSKTSEKAKDVPDDRCRICNVSPYHRVKECALVRNQPIERLDEIIRRLERQGGVKEADAIHLLQRMKAKQQKKPATLAYP